MIFKLKTVEKSKLSELFFCTSALLNPADKKTSAIAINAFTIAIKPYCSGSKIRAKIMDTTKEIICAEAFSINFQIIPVNKLGIKFSTFLQLFSLKSFLLFFHQPKHRTSLQTYTLNSSIHCNLLFSIHKESPFHFLL